MDLLLFHLRGSLRELRNHPGPSLLAILTLALGLGLTAGTYSFVAPIIWDHLPIPQSERLMILRGHNPEQGRDRLGTLPHDYVDFKAQQDVFEDLVAYSETRFNLSDAAGYPERHRGAYISHEFLTSLRIKPLIGRSFNPGDDLPGTAPVVILGHRIWQRRFEGKDDVIGRKILLNGESAEIVGVMPPGFRFPRFHDLWVPLRLDLSAVPRGAGSVLRVMGRLKNDATLESAQRQLDTLALDLAERFPETNTGREILVQHFTRRWVGSRWVKMFSSLVFAAGFVLLIGCANVAALLLGRAMVQLRETAIHSAMGASRGQLLLRSLLFSLVLAALATLLALPLAKFIVDRFGQIMAGLEIPYWSFFELQPRGIALAAGLALGAAAVAGFYPAWKVSKTDIHALIKKAETPRLGYFLRALVILEVAMAFVLLTFSSLLVRSVHLLDSLDFGDIDRAQVQTAKISIPAESYPRTSAKGGVGGADRRPFGSAATHRKSDGHEQSTASGKAL